MIDRTIPFYNIILKKETPFKKRVRLPEGYRFKMYEKGDELAWAQLEYDIGDFESVDEAVSYFESTYLNNSLDISKRGVFVLDDKNEIVGSCIAWHDLKQQDTIASLHWLVVAEKQQHKGLGKALCQKVLKIFTNEKKLPVYIHTQPWSYNALMLYIHQGFKIQKVDTFAKYENQYFKAMAVLKNVLNEDLYEQLINHSED